MDFWLKPLLSLLFAAVVCVVCAAPTHGQTSADWQQRVEYDMDIRLLPDRHRMQGIQRLTYHNNAPDTLYRVFYHLYFNAFDPASMMAERNRHLPDPDRRIVPRIFELGEDEVGWHRIHTLTQDGRPVSFHVDDTVLEVDLAEPIPPGERAVFVMTFDAQVPLQTRRSGRDNREGIDYSMSQWYPKLAAYDERGWHADPYIGREFYAPFGTFNVRITLPAEYTIGATGVLQNAEEVGHGYQADPTAAYDHAPGDSLTWHFVAENVHDFAWAADPDYLHDRIERNGRTYHLLYQPDVAAGWADLATWVPEVIEFYSREIGPYPYPQFTVAQAGDGGMEYPMINFITGGRAPRSLFGVTAHEAAHEWFYAAVATNEADYAWMDEGFTDYWTAEAAAHILGRGEANHTGSFISVLAMHEYDLYERLNTPSDWFETNAAYGVAAYAGGAMIADMLGYVISDSLRDVFFQEYFRRFTFRHPNPYDVEAVAEDVSGLILDWYFEQFLNTEGTLDYAVEGLRSTRAGDAWRTTVVLEREDDLVMPVDLRLTLADGSVQWVNIPLTIMEGHKPVPPGWIVAEAWPWTSPRYTLVLDLPEQVVEATIDPRGQTPETTRLNNTTGFPARTAFLEPPAPGWFEYGVGYRPLLQYAHDYGFGLGLTARGAYLFGDHRAKAMVKLWPQVIFSGGEEPELDGSLADASFFDGIDYAFSYERDVPAMGTFTSVAAAARKHLGVLEHTLSLSTRFGRFLPLTSADRRLSLALIHQYVPSGRSFRLNDFTWFFQEHMASARATYRVGDGADRIEVGAEFGVSFEDLLDCRDQMNHPTPCVGEFRQSATHAFLEAVRTAGLRGFRARAHLKIGLGMENLAFHKRFRLGAAPVEAAWRNDAYRAIAGAMDDALRDAHFAAFESPGPVAYLLQAAGDPDDARTLGGTPLGTSMAAGSVVVATGPVSRRPWLRPLSFEAFSGAGTVWGLSSLGHDRFSFDHVIADAGLGVTYAAADVPALRTWAAQSDVLQALRFTARFPLWVSDPKLIAPDEDPVAFRWLIGITLND